LLRFETRATERATSVENWGQISHFLTLVEIREKIGEMSETNFQAQTIGTSENLWRGCYADWESRAVKATDIEIVTVKMYLDLNYQVSV